MGNVLAAEEPSSSLSDDELADLFEKASIEKTRLQAMADSLASDLYPVSAATIRQVELLLTDMRVAARTTGMLATLSRADLRRGAVAWRRRYRSLHSVGGEQP